MTRELADLIATYETRAQDNLDNSLHGSLLTATIYQQVAKDLRAIVGSYGGQEVEAPTDDDVEAFLSFLEGRDPLGDHVLDVLEWCRERFAAVPDGWRLQVQYRREVVCPRPCGYMAAEIRDEGSTRVTGICTKCGHTWHYVAPEPQEPNNGPE